MATRGGWASRLTAGAVAGPMVGRWPGVPAMPLPRHHGGEPWHGVVVPGEPRWRWIHFHRFFLVFWWIHLHGLHTISHMSNGHRYHAADGVPPPTLPPLPPPLLQPPLCLPAQTWAATRLAAVGPLSSNHGRNPSASKLSELWASCRNPRIYRVQNNGQ